VIPNVSEHWNAPENHGAAADSERRWSADITRSDDSTVQVEFSDTPVDIGGERLILMIGRDVTEQRQLERQLRLGQRLEAVGRLAAGIAHDFNNILTAILGFSDLLLDDLEPSAKGQAGLLEIRKATQRAAELTRQLLAFGRQQILQPKIVDMNTIVAEVIPMLRRLIFADTQIVVTPRSDVGLVSIDPTQLEQILVNLVVNASDAMPAGGTITIEIADATIEVETPQNHLPMAPGEYVVLSVSDTGVGMDEATTHKIFDPFFTTKERGKGTGLGLATVYGIVKQSGGHIWVYSEIDHGSIFRVYLPRALAAVPTSGGRASTTLEAPGGSETVLLVEDEDAVRQLVQDSLSRSGYHVLVASNPKQAFDVASHFDGPIHLLLSDVMMPESGDVPLYDRVALRRPSVRVLYMSGYANDAILHRGLLSQGAPFLQKPFTTTALKRKVREVLDASAAES
jgi:two-component system cell cycle sensor histidine kinase/response regulator CckA